MKHFLRRPCKIRQTIWLVNSMEGAEEHEPQLQLYFTYRMQGT